MAPAIASDLIPANGMGFNNVKMLSIWSLADTPFSNTTDSGYIYCQLKATLRMHRQQLSLWLSVMPRQHHRITGASEPLNFG